MHQAANRGKIILVYTAHLILPGGHGGLAIRFKNTTANPMVVKEVSVKSCPCNAGNSGFWAFGSYLDSSMAQGWATDYYCFLRVNNNAFEESTASDDNIFASETASRLNSLDKSSWQFSQAQRVHLDRVNMNMHFKGTSGTNPASFGEGVYADTAGGLKFKKFIFNDCPVIQPQGNLLLHFDVYTAMIHGGMVRIIPDPKEMEIKIEQERGPYIWRMTDGHWKLVRPVNIFTGDKWSDIEHIDK